MAVLSLGRVISQDLSPWMRRSWRELNGTGCGGHDFWILADFSVYELQTYSERAAVPMLFTMKEL